MPRHRGRVQPLHADAAGDGAVLQMPALVFFLAGWVWSTARWMTRRSSTAVLMIFIIAAVITPKPGHGQPDARRRPDDRALRDQHRHRVGFGKKKVPTWRMADGSVRHLPSAITPSSDPARPPPRSAHPRASPSPPPLCGDLAIPRPRLSAPCRPTVSRSGMPSRSASLNLTPGLRPSRSSCRTSNPAASRSDSI